MGRFNLIEEPWIVVMTDDKGTTKEVSLSELFADAHNFKRLAGDTPAQDFAVLRLLLAIMHTVFSRVDESGKPYEYLTLDERFKPTSAVEDDDQEEYQEAMVEAWKAMWEEKKVPAVVNEYLSQWKDHFNLYDQEVPFFQVTNQELYGETVKKPSSISGKLMNRLISESNNKVELFSPASEGYKNNLTDAELARWLITFQGYTGTGDKTKHPDMSGSASKGWLLGLGGIYLGGRSLSETLILNMIVLEEHCKVQIPVWEKSFDRNIKDLLMSAPDNLAELYTHWSRLIYIDPNIDLKSKKDGVKLEAVQLPGINPQDFFLEPMTMWFYPKSGDNKGHFIPRKHDGSQSFWRSFGQVSLPNSKHERRRPGIVDWQNWLVVHDYLDEEFMILAAVGMEHNNDASNMPNNDIYDELNIHDQVLADVIESGWVERITDEVDTTKSVIEGTFRNLLRKIEFIRGVRKDLKKDSKADEKNKAVIQEVYFEIDEPFRQWIAGILPDDSKEMKVKLWRQILKEVILKQAKKLLENASNRDYIGRENEKGIENIATAYNRFQSYLNKQLSEGGRK